MTCLKNYDKEYCGKWFRDWFIEIGEGKLNNNRRPMAPIYKMGQWPSLIQMQVNKVNGSQVLSHQQTVVQSKVTI